MVLSQQPLIVTIGTIKFHLTGGWRVHSYWKCLQQRRTHWENRGPIRVSWMHCWVLTIGSSLVLQPYALPITLSSLFSKVKIIMDPVMVTGLLLPCCYCSKKNLKKEVTATQSISAKSLYPMLFQSFKLPKEQWVNCNCSQLEWLVFDESSWDATLPLTNMLIVKFWWYPNEFCSGTI